MIKNLVIVKVKKEEERLMTDIYKKAKKTTEGMKKELKWFKFAKKSKCGYKFLGNKEAQWEKLKLIAQDISRSYKSYTMGQIVDIISELVNTTVSEYINLKKRNFKKRLQEKKYLESLLIEVVGLPYYIAGYPWLIFHKDISKNFWKAKDLTTGRIVDVVRKNKGQFVVYEMTFYL